MLQQRAARLDIGQLRLGVGKLGLRPAHIQAGGDALVVPVIGEVQRLAIDGDGVGQQLGLGIQAAQLQIIVGQLRLQAQAHAPPDRRNWTCASALPAATSLRMRPHRSRSQATDDARQIVAIISRLVGAAQRPVGGLLVGIGMAAGIDGAETGRTAPASR